MPEAAVQVSIREATRRDVDDIHALVTELAIATGMRHKMLATPRDYLEHGFGKTPAFHALIARRGGEPVGLSLYFYEFSTWLGRPGIYIQDLVVAEAARGSGLGRRLVAETVRAGQRRGATHLRLSVDRHNESAINFYRSIGMDASGDERIYHAHGDAFQHLVNLA